MEVEVRTREELEELIQCLERGEAGSVTRVMLDNMVKADGSAKGECLLASLCFFSAVALHIIGLLCIDPLPSSFHGKRTDTVGDFLVHTCQCLHS